jgi:leukotriene-A4 hydrolase
LNFLAAKFGRERFDAFLKGYFDHFAFKSISTEQFLGYLQENLLDPNPGIVTREAVNAWVFGPGIPADAVLPVSSAFEPVDQVRTAWLAGNTPPKMLVLDTHDWVTQQWLYFLNNMPAALSIKQLTELDQTFKFTQTPNAEIARSWLILGIRNSYQPSFPRLQEYLKTIGRPKLINPLYAELMKTPAGAAFAKTTFSQARAGYDARVAAAIDAVVNPPDEASAE